MGATQNSLCSQELYQDKFSLDKLPLSTDCFPGYFHFIMTVTDKLNSNFSNFPDIFKNVDLCWNDIGEYKKIYAEETDSLKKSRRSLISSFKLENYTAITPLLNLNLEI